MPTMSDKARWHRFYTTMKWLSMSPWSGSAPIHEEHGDRNNNFIKDCREILGVRTLTGWIGRVMSGVCFISHEGRRLQIAEWFALDTGEPIKAIPAVYRRSNPELKLLPSFHLGDIEKDPKYAENFSLRLPGQPDTLAARIIAILSRESKRLTLKDFKKLRKLGKKFNSPALDSMQFRLVTEKTARKNEEKGKRLQAAADAARKAAAEAEERRAAVEAGKRRAASAASKAEERAQSDRQSAEYRWASFSICMKWIVMRPWLGARYANEERGIRIDRMFQMCREILGVFSLRSGPRGRNHDDGPWLQGFISCENRRAALLRQRIRFDWDLEYQALPTISKDRYTASVLCGTIDVSDQRLAQAIANILERPSRTLGYDEFEMLHNWGVRANADRLSAAVKEWKQRKTKKPAPAPAEPAAPAEPEGESSQPLRSHTICAGPITLEYSEPKGKLGLPPLPAPAEPAPAPAEAAAAAAPAPAEPAPAEAAEAPAEPTLRVFERTPTLKEALALVLAAMRAENALQTEKTEGTVIDSVVVKADGSVTVNRQQIIVKSVVEKLTI